MAQPLDMSRFEAVAEPAGPKPLDMSQFEPVSETQAETPAKAAPRDVVSGAPIEHGAGQTAVRSWANTLSGGFLDEAAGWIDAAIAERSLLPSGEAYRRERDKYRQIQAQGEEENPTASKIGTAAGIGTAILAGRPTAAPVSTAGAALRGAGAGATYALGNSEADLTKNEWGKAAWDAAIGAGTGAALGVAGKKIGDWVQGAKGRADRTLMSDIGQRANKGIRDKMAENADATLESARKLGGSKVAQQAPELLEKAAKAQQIAGQKLGRIDKAVQDGFGPMRTAKAIDRLAELEKRFTDNGQLSRAKAVQNVADEMITAFGDAAPVNNFRQYVSSLGDKAYPNLSEKASARVNKQIYAAVSGALKEHAQDAAKAVPELKPIIAELPAVSREFGAMKDIATAARQRARLAPYKPTGLRSFTVRGLAEAALDKTVGQASRPMNEKLAALSRMAAAGDQRAAKLLQFMTNAPRVGLTRVGPSEVQDIRNGMSPEDESEPDATEPGPMVSVR